MQFTINNKEYSVKVIASIVWIIFLIFYWNDTFAMFQNYHEFLVKKQISPVVSTLLFGLWSVIFLFPALFPIFFMKGAELLLSKRSILSALKRSIYITIITSVIRGLMFLLVPLFIITSMFVFRTDYLDSIPPDFTLFLQSTFHSTLPFDKLNTYHFVVLLPHGVANIFPDLFFIVITFATEFPILSSAIVLISLLEAVWQRFEAIKYFRELCSNDDNTMIQLNAEEYQLLIESFGDEETLKKELKKVRELKEKFLEK